MRRITASIPDADAATLQRLAAEHGSTIAAVVRAAVKALTEDEQLAASAGAHIQPDSRGGRRPGAGRPRRTWMAAPDLATAIRQELARDDEDFAMRLLARFVADLRSLSRPNDLARCLDTPGTTGSLRWDALIAAVVSRECRLRGRDAPAWTKAPPLLSWWFPLLPDPILTARTMQRTPIDFSVRGIWLDAKALETA